MKETNRFKVGYLYCTGTCSGYDLTVLCTDNRVKTIQAFIDTYLAHEQQHVPPVEEILFGKDIADEEESIFAGDAFDLLPLYVGDKEVNYQEFCDTLLKAQIVVKYDYEPEGLLRIKGIPQIISHLRSECEWTGESSIYGLTLTSENGVGKIKYK